MLAPRANTVADRLRSTSLEVVVVFLLAGIDIAASISSLLGFGLLVDVVIFAGVFLTFRRPLLGTASSALVWSCSFPCLPNT